MNDQITVVTCTIGDSAGRLEHLLAELRRFTSIGRRFTSIPFRQIVSDDGTLNAELVKKQQAICGRYPDCLWTQNGGPTWGISYNFNWALKYVDTPWAFLIEDGVRPSFGWLETALDFIAKIGEKKWGGYPVGMAGCTHLQDWTLAMAGMIKPNILSVMDFFRGHPLAYDHFYGPWNDGKICWPRMLPGLYKAITGGVPANWDSDVKVFADMLHNGFTWTDADKTIHPMEAEQRWIKFHGGRRWPDYRGASCGWYPGALLILNMEAFRKVGRMRDGCTFFEGHLGTRMGINGYLSLVLETPPFLHCPSQGFKQSYLAATPRHHRDTDEVFKEDFRHGFMDAPNVLASGRITVEEQRTINAALAEVPLDLPEGWK